MLLQTGRPPPRSSVTASSWAAPWTCAVSSIVVWDPGQHETPSEVQVAHHVAHHSPHRITGDVYVAAGLHVTAPLPLARLRETLGNAVHTHLFLTAGSLVGGAWDEPIQNLGRRLRNSAVASCGAGLVVDAGAFTVELNACYPLHYSSTDLPVTGMQFGAGISFL